jgi:hypothetical protein
MPAVNPLGATPIPFSIALTGTGTAEWSSTDLLPEGMTGKVLGIVAEVDTSANLGAATLYALSGNGAVSAQPNDRLRAYESAALTPADDAPDAFLDEVVDNPQTFRGLRVALLATWTGVCTITGVIHVDRAG